RAAHGTAGAVPVGTRDVRGPGPGRSRRAARGGGGPDVPGPGEGRPGGHPRGDGRGRDPRGAPDRRGDRRPAGGRRAQPHHPGRVPARHRRGCQDAHPPGDGDPGGGSRGAPGPGDGPGSAGGGRNHRRPPPSRAPPAPAVHQAAGCRSTALMTSDPARRLATALGLPPSTGGRATVRVGRGRSMDALQLDTKRTFDDLVDRFAGSPERRDRILSNPFYRRFADSLGGTHEYMAMEKLHQLAEEERHDAIVIDTPPTASALSFLDAPKRLTDFLGGRFLRAMLWPTPTAGRFGLGAARVGARAFLRVAGRLVGAEVLADTVDFLAAFEGMYGGFADRAARVMELLASPGCAFVVVAAPTPPSLEETGVFLERTAAAGIRTAAIVVNRWHPAAVVPPPGAEAASERLDGR